MHKNNLKRVKFKDLHIIVEQSPIPPVPLSTDIHVNLDQPVHASISTPRAKSQLESVRELVGLVAAGTGIFAALLYLAGRSFASGYFTAMNIPSYQVSFSLWEYGEAAWMPLLLYPSGIMVVSGLLWGIIFILLDWLKRKIKLQQPNWHLPKISDPAKHWFSMAGGAFTVFLLVILVVLTLQFITEWGKVVGRTALLENSAQIELISAAPLALDNNLSIVPSNGQGYYIYKDFHLLTVNNGKYYLFREIDSTTCKPAKVYVIEAGESLQVNLLPPVSLASQCDKATSTGVVATSTVIAPIP